MDATSDQLLFSFQYCSRDQQVPLLTLLLPRPCGVTGLQVLQRNYGVFTRAVTPAFLPPSAYPYGQIDTHPAGTATEARGEA